MGYGERTMRNLILTQIKEYRFNENNFCSGRWGGFFLTTDGLRVFTNKKDANRSNSNAVRLRDTNDIDFENLSDELLLNALIGITRQRMRQM